MAAMRKIETEDTVMGIENGGVGVKVGRRAREGWADMVS
jgi:hypothetical protein